MAKEITLDWEDFSQLLEIRAAAALLLDQLHRELADEAAAGHAVSQRLEQTRERLQRAVLAYDADVTVS